MQTVRLISLSLVVLSLLAQPAPQVPDWLPPFPFAVPEGKGAPSHASNSAYVALGRPADVIAHYQAHLRKSGIAFTTDFNGLGTTIRASTEETDCVIRVSETSRVNVDCAGHGKLGAPPSVQTPLARSEFSETDFRHAQSGTSKREVTARQPTQDAASLKADIAAVQEQINTAETENEKYAGGLVKSLVVARIAILQQTEAMLQQRLKASTYGISLKYTVNGSTFVPPASADELLSALEREIADNQTKIARQEAETARYSGGLVQAMSVATLATMRQTQAMLDQKRLALKYGLPQYVGFQSRADSAPGTSQSSRRTEIPAASNERDWGIVSVDSRVTESNNVWSKYAWKLTLRNESDQPQAFLGTIEFQDSDGFIVDTGNANGMLVPAKSEQVFTGYTLIPAEAAGKVAQTVAKIRISR